jgi:hypothetical protein
MQSLAQTISDDVVQLIARSKEHQHTQLIAHVLGSAFLSALLPEVDGADAKANHSG